MTRVDTARVDLGAAHNGRVVERHIFLKPDGSTVIVDKGRHVPVVRVCSRPGKYGIGYVTKGW